MRPIQSKLGLGIHYTIQLSTIWSSMRVMPFVVAVSLALLVILVRFSRKKKFSKILFNFQNRFVSVLDKEIYEKTDNESDEEWDMLENATGLTHT